MNRKERFIIFPLLIVLLVAATFFDLKLSQAVYGTNLFTAFFEIVGEVPITFLALFGAIILFKYRSRKNKVVGFILAVAYGLLAALFSAMLGFMTMNYINENIAHELPAIAAVGIALAGLVLAVLLSKSIPQSRSREAVTFAIIAIVYVLMIVIVMNACKAVWGRMRIREMSDPVSEFTPWYVIINRGGFDNRFASFPSGHAMNSAGIYLVTFLPAFLPGLSGKQTSLRIIAYAWAAVIGFSRVAAGAHFLTDVIAGILLSYLLLWIVSGAICKLRKDSWLFSDEKYALNEAE